MGGWQGNSWKYKNIFECEKQRPCVVSVMVLLRALLATPHVAEPEVHVQCNISVASGDKSNNRVIVVSEVGNTDASYSTECH